MSQRLVLGMALIGEPGLLVLESPNESGAKLSYRLFSRVTGVGM
nr:hypothetical protein [Natronorubrum sediminis]